MVAISHGCDKHLPIKHVSGGISIGVEEERDGTPRYMLDPMPPDPTLPLRSLLSHGKS